MRQSDQLPEESSTDYFNRVYLNIETRFTAKTQQPTAFKPLFNPMNPKGYTHVRQKITDPAEADIHDTLYQISLIELQRTKLIQLANPKKPTQSQHQYIIKANQHSKAYKLFFQQLHSSNQSQKSSKAHSQQDTLTKISNHHQQNHYRVKSQKTSFKSKHKTNHTTNKIIKKKYGPVVIDIFKNYKSKEKKKKSHESNDIKKHLKFNSAKLKNDFKISQNLSEKKVESKHYQLKKNMQNLSEQKFKNNVNKNEKNQKMKLIQGQRMIEKNGKSRINQKTSNNQQKRKKESIVKNKKQTKVSQVIKQKQQLDKADYFSSKSRLYCKGKMTIDSNSSESENSAVQKLIKTKSKERPENWQQKLRKLTHYNPHDKKYRERDKMQITESSTLQMLGEEKRSIKLGIFEEDEEMHREKVRKLAKIS